MRDNGYILSMTVSEFQRAYGDFVCMPGELARQKYGEIVKTGGLDELDGSEALNYVYVVGYRHYSPRPSAVYAVRGPLDAPLSGLTCELVYPLETA